MSIKQDWDKSKLGDYLLYDCWHPDQAFRVLAGLDYYVPDEGMWEPDCSLEPGAGSTSATTNACKLPEDTIPDQWQLGYLPKQDEDCIGGEKLDYWRFHKEMRAKFERLQIFWKNAQLDANETHSPAFFIEWAQSKKHCPDWLDWAIERSLYKPIQEMENTNKPIATKERNTLLVIIAALAKEAKIDLSKPSKAAEQIANMTQQQGSPIDHATIEQKIKQIDDALERRAK